MKFLVRTTLALSLSVFLTAAGPICPATGQPMGRSGCCSHHGGVCGCDGAGMQRCCDGASSPSCACGE